MNTHKPSEVVYFRIPVQSATGAAVNADSTPDVLWLKNGTADGAVAITVSNVSTGNYTGSATVPSGYAADVATGVWVQVVARAVVGGVTGPYVPVYAFRVESQSLSQVAAPGAAMTLQANAITASTIQTDAITAAAVKADAVTKMQAGLSTYAGGAVASVTGNVGGNVVGNVNGNVAGSVGSLGAQAKADVNAEADTALADYDPPTRAELTTDKDSIISALPDVSGLSTFDSATDKVTLAAATHTGAIIPTVTTLTNAPSDSAGITTLLGRLTATRADYLDVLSGIVAAVQSGLATLVNQTTLLTRSARVDALLENSDGDRLTAKALEQAPAGSGGDLSGIEASLATLDARLAGIPTTESVAPITANGERITLTQGADYTAASGWPVQQNITGVPAALAYSVGITELRLIAANGALQVVGEASSITGGFRASFDVGKAVTAALDEGASDYFIEATLTGEIETPTLSKGKLHVDLGGVQVTDE